MVHLQEELVVNVEQRIKDVLVPIRKFDSPAYHKSRQSNIEDISVTWTIGGTLKNGVWNKDTTVNAQPEPDFIKLDEILEHLWPNISLLAYKKLVRTLVRYTANVYNGYNYTGESEKKVSIRQLAEYLVENNI